MTILSFSFLAFVLITLVVYYLTPKHYRWIPLLIGSIVFYFLSSKWLIIFPLLATVVIFFLGLVIDSKNEQINDLKNRDLVEEEKKKLKETLKNAKKRYVVLGVVLCILCLIVTKYAGFILENTNGIFKLFGSNTGFTLTHVLMPLGISYYTLEAISYVVDIYRGKMPASKNIFQVALYLLYFPKVIEGPITRFKDFITELTENNSLDFANMTIGLDYIAYGLFKKMVIADRAGIFVNQTFGSSSGLTSIVAMILYTVQIYAEFGGCIDIVRGVSYLFGIALPENFRQPFFSKSIQEFWQRWHISLGAWIKEYVFFPVSLSKLNRKVCLASKEKLNDHLSKFIIVAFPLLFVWLVNGIWHGASYKYVVYGMYYYVFMMLAVLIKPFTDALLAKLKIDEPAMNAFRVARTCLFVVVGMTLFRASTLSEFGRVIMSIFEAGDGLANHGLVPIDFAILIVGNVLILIVSILEEKKKISMERGFTEKPWVRALVYTFILCCIVIFGIYGEGYDASEFIYGAF